MEAAQQGISTDRSARLISRVSFEPLSTLAELNGGLTRDGSGLSGDSNSEYEAWRVSGPAAGWGATPPPPPPPAPPVVPPLVDAAASTSGAAGTAALLHCCATACQQAPQVLQLPLAAGCCRAPTTPAPSSHHTLALRAQEEHPCALHSFDRIAALAAGKLVAVFLDYDGQFVVVQRSSGPAFQLLPAGCCRCWAAGCLLRGCCRCCTLLARCSAPPACARRSSKADVRCCPPFRPAGTLTPIVSNPDAALMGEQVRAQPCDCKLGCLLPG